MERLEAIPGWLWSPPRGKQAVNTKPAEEKFELGLRALAKFQIKDGRTQIPKGSKAAGVGSLQHWAADLRKAYREGDPSITPERREKREALAGWEWAPGQSKGR